MCYDIYSANLLQGTMMKMVAFYSPISCPCQLVRTISYIWLPYTAYHIGLYMASQLFFIFIFFLWKDMLSHDIATFLPLSAEECRISTKHFNNHMNCYLLFDDRDLFFRVFSSYHHRHCNRSQYRNPHGRALYYQKVRK